MSWNWLYRQNSGKMQFAITTANIYVKKYYRFKHTCNDNNDIRRRKQQKLAYHIFTSTFPISSLQCHELLTL